MIAPQLPVGTQVVLRTALTAGLPAAAGPATGDATSTAQRGATGRVVGHINGGRYEVQLADGRMLTAQRDQLALRKAYQQELSHGDAVDGHRLVREHTIYAAVVGSRAFGLAVEDSDTDLRGVCAVTAILSGST